MSLFLILTVIQAIVAAALVGVVLMQRSEGGGLGIGGSPGGALGARGAADFLTRSTRWLAIVFVGMSILLAALAVNERSVGGVSSTLDREVEAPAPQDLLGGAEGTGGEAAGDDPLASGGSEEAPQPDDPLAE